MARRTLLLLGLLAGCTKPATPAPAPSQSEGTPEHSTHDGPTAVAGVAPAAPPPLVPQATQPLDLEAIPVSPDALTLARAQRLLRDDPAAASSALEGLEGPAAHYLRARALLAIKKVTEAHQQAEKAKSDPAIAPWVQLLEGEIAGAQGKTQAAVAMLAPLLAQSAPLRQAAFPVLLALIEDGHPEALIAHAAALEKAVPLRDLDAKSRLFGAVAKAHRSVGDLAKANEVEVRRYIEEAVSPVTPPQPPAGVVLTVAQRLARIQVLLDAHRSERVLQEATALQEQVLTPEQTCTLDFAVGMAHRKLHHYADAEKHLTRVAESCRDQDLARRAMYVNAKVISIYAGLRAVSVIEAFAKRFAQHTMVDDVLFWAGDLYQHRQRYPEAEKYYTRIETMPEKGDHCAEARWRLAWIAYRQNDIPRMHERLARIQLDDGCAPQSFDQARAAYWIGRTSEGAARRAALEKAVALTPLGFYGQMALKRLVTLYPQDEPSWRAKFAVPPGEGVPHLCPGDLASDPGFLAGLELWRRGLHEEARMELTAVQVPPRPSENPTTDGGGASPSAQACGPSDPALLLALMLDRVGAHQEGHWRLRTEFAEHLERIPSARDIGLFKAAYPLAYRDELGAAEREHRLPTMFLQALSREESAFDAQVVSWAGAYGLTQLLHSTGRLAGNLLSPKVAVPRPEDLLDPALNARLGGALMAHLMKRFKDSPALSLAAYNASENFANTLWKRHREHEFDHFVEEITIKETRSYVARVLKTFGVYLWLYEDQLPVLPTALRLPQLN